MKSSQLATPFSIGLLLLLGVGVTVYMTMTLKGNTGFGSNKGYSVYATFDDVTGLVSNSRVRMAGIPIGYVEDIELKGEKARVTIRITSDVQLHRGIKQKGGYYKNGATVKKRLLSFIGDYFLEITAGQAGPVLEDGDEIKNVVPTMGANKVFSELSAITEDVQEVTDSLATVFGKEQGRRKIEKTLDNLQKMSATLEKFARKNDKRLSKIVGNAEDVSRDIKKFTARGTQSLETTLDDARAIVKEVKHMIGQSSSDVQKGLGTLRGTLNRLQTTLDSINYSLQNVEDITDKVNEGKGTVGELVNDSTISDKTEQILSDAGDIVHRVSKLKTIVELRTEYHLNRDQFKNVFGLRLQPSKYKYYLFEFVDDFRGAQTITMRDVQTTKTTADDQDYTTTTVTTKDDFRLSAQMARGLELTSWLSMMGRFGIVENSGGMGVDVLAGPNKRFQLSTDLFEFANATNPRLRSFARIRFFEHAYISGGLDDVLNPDRRSFFIGGGVQFDDKDLKALFTTVGVPVSP